MKFSEQRMESVKVKLTQCDKEFNKVKNAIMQVTYVLNAPCLINFFFCHIGLYRVKVTSYEKFSCNLTLEV